MPQVSGSFVLQIKKKMKKTQVLGKNKIPSCLALMYINPPLNLYLIFLEVRSVDLGVQFAAYA